MRWNLELEHRLALALARLDASQRRWEMLGCTGVITDDLRRVEAPPAPQLTEQSKDAAQEISV